MAKKQSKKKSEKVPVEKKDENERAMMAREGYWSPFQMMRQFEREMDEIWRNFDTRFGFDYPRRWHRPGAHHYPAVRQPLLDIEDTGKNIMVTAELPGIPKKNIDISVTKDSIEISARTGLDKEEKGKDYYHRERSFHSYHRQLPLPAEVDQNKADAELNDGILKIKLPKKDTTLKEKVKKVFVK